MIRYHQRLDLGLIQTEREGEGKELITGVANNILDWFMQEWSFYKVRINLILALLFHSLNKRSVLNWLIIANVFMAEDKVWLEYKLEGR